MLTKFETRSARVKGTALHARRPWVLAALHSGAVQLWDYRAGLLVEQWDGEAAIGPGGTPSGATGPVRCVAFHPTQALFASGADDGKVRVYDTRTRKCVFVLSGHMDYVRSVAFHAEHPWLASASDDQTVRVWNWQSRSCISVLAGHAHYVMCAAFHPTEDVLASASLDGTARVWDLGALRRRGSSSAARLPSGGVELFGSPAEGAVRHVLEGHERGVNWASFGPRGTLVTASDDRTVRLWRLSESRAWETDVLRGHANNVSAAVFDCTGETVVSAGEDRTLRVHRPGTRLPAEVHRGERFWCVCAHPSAPLFAAGHDGGLLLFKLGHERPAAVSADGVGAAYSVVGTDILDLGGRIVAQLERPVALPAVLWRPAGDDAFIVAEPRGEKTALRVVRPGAPVREIEAASAVALGRGRVATLDGSAVTVRSHDLAAVRSYPAPGGTSRLLYGCGRLFCVAADGISVLDAADGRQISRVPLPSGISPPKYAAADDDGRVALYSSRGLVVLDAATGKLAWSSKAAVKGAAWDAGVLYYSTALHVRYALSGGAGGAVCATQEPLYLLAVRGASVVAASRGGALHAFRIDTAEVALRASVSAGGRVPHGASAGAATLSWLRTVGRADAALALVSAPAERLPLAAECGDAEALVESAGAVDTAAGWRMAADALLNVGEYARAASAYARCGASVPHVCALAGLPIETGGSPDDELLSAVYSCDATRLAEALRSSGDPRFVSLSAAVVDGDCSSGHCPAVRAWPRETASASGIGGMAGAHTGGWGDASLDMDGLSLDDHVAAVPDAGVPLAGGWGDGDVFEDAVPAQDTEDPVLPEAGAVDCIVDCDAALRVAARLREKHGVVVFAGLEPHVGRLSAASLVCYPSIDGLSFVLPSGLPCGHAPDAEHALGLATAGRFGEAADAFAQLLCDAVFGGAVGPAGAPDMPLVLLARDYILCMRMELARKSVVSDDPAGALRLAVAMTALPHLRDAHRVLTLRAAQVAAYRASCPVLAALLASQLLTIVADDAAAAKILAARDRLPLSHVDALAVDVPETLGGALMVDASSYAPVAGPAAPCMLCGALHDASLDVPAVCAVCGLAAVASPADEF